MGALIVVVQLPYGPRDCLVEDSHVTYAATFIGLELVVLQHHDNLQFDAYMIKSWPLLGLKTFVHFTLFINLRGRIPLDHNLHEVDVMQARRLHGIAWRVQALHAASLQDNPVQGLGKLVLWKYNIVRIHWQFFFGGARRMNQIKYGIIIPDRMVSAARCTSELPLNGILRRPWMDLSTRWKRRVANITTFTWSAMIISWEIFLKIGIVNYWNFFGLRENDRRNDDFVTCS